MADSSTERNLLFGTLALQMDFITRDALVAAIKTCATEKDKSLGRVLESQGTLAEQDDALIEALVSRILEMHDHDARRSLGLVARLDAIRHDLEAIGDEDLDRTLDYTSSCAEQAQMLQCTTSAQLAGAARSRPARFRLLKFHARGGLGEVWTAHDAELNREVALKQIQERHADSPPSQARFVQEAEVTGRLEHRGIVPVYSLGHFANGRPFYAMRFVNGTSFDDAIKKFHAAASAGPTAVDPSLELRRLLTRFVDVCNTVAYAHSRGVLHRDLKPGNIIIDEYGETLVVDWGLAKTGTVDADSDVTGGTHQPVSTSITPYTRAGTAMGTPGFMSPEQATGHLAKLGPASDVYSLGATLYCLLTGTPPFGGTDLSAIASDVCAGNFPRPRQLIATVPPALEAICLKAMAVAPESRYDSARALGEEIERWLADQPVLAFPEPLPARVLRWVRRRKQWVAAAAAVLVLTLFGLTLDHWRITREQAKTADQLAMTRDALRELLDVSGVNLAYISNTESLREYLAQLVLGRYQQLGDKFPADPGVRLETARAYRVIGGIERLTGQFDKSRASYDTAIKELIDLCERDPRQTDYRRWLAEVFLDRGELNHMYGRTIDAENDFHAAIDHASKHRSASPSATYLRMVASALTNPVGCEEFSPCQG
jgi:eukaryotic-like serine/threonine-protein kinase